jgi:hypothetical protein
MVIWRAEQITTINNCSDIDTGSADPQQESDGSAFLFNAMRASQAILT